MIRLITLGFCFSILFAFYALCDQSDVKYYITPTVGNLAVLLNMPTFARSFEYYDGAFYVGLGTSTGSLNQACGNIYKVILPSE